MTFEIGDLGSLDSTRWTSTAITPFGPAPGAGVGLGVGLGAGVRRPRRAATTAFESGFAAEPVGAETQADELRVLAKKWAITVTKKSVAQGEVPAALVQFYFTDRGVISQGILDKNLYGVAKNAGYKVSKTAKFEPIPVTWTWKHDKQADFYYPVVKQPVVLAGMPYAGNAVKLPVYSEKAASAATANLPSQLYVYTFAVTTGENSFTDEDGAKLLTLLRQAILSQPYQTAAAYANVRVTLLGANPEVFGNGVTPEPTPPSPKPGPSPVVLGVSAIALIAIFNSLVSGDVR